MNQRIKDFLEEKVSVYNGPNFIELDPISIPHRFQKKQDIEIAGFCAAILAVAVSIRRVLAAAASNALLRARKSGVGPIVVGYAF